MNDNKKNKDISDFNKEIKSESIGVKMEELKKRIQEHERTIEIEREKSNSFLEEKNILQSDLGKAIEENREIERIILKLEEENSDLQKEKEKLEKDNNQILKEMNEVKEKFKKNIRQNRVIMPIVVLLALIVGGGLSYFYFNNKGVSAIDKSEESTIDSSLITKDSLDNKVIAAKDSVATSVNQGKTDEKNNEKTDKDKKKDKENPVSPPTSKKKVVFAKAMKNALAIKGYYSQTVKYKGVEFDVFAVDLRKAALRMHWLDNTNQPYENLGTMKNKLETSGAEKMLFATNGGIYSKSYKPEGLFVTKGQVQIPLNTNDGTGNFYLKLNGVFAVDAQKRAYVVPTSAYPQLSKAKNIQYATQSGPLLRYNSQIHKKFNEPSKNKRIRNGVGVVENMPHQVVFAITKQECNFYNFSMLFEKELGCNSALYLDGVISRMYIDDSKTRKDLDGDFVSIINVSTK